MEVRGSTDGGLDGSGCCEVAALKGELVEARKLAASLTEEVKQREQCIKLLAKKVEESGALRAGKVSWGGGLGGRGGAIYGYHMSL